MNYILNSNPKGDGHYDPAAFPLLTGSLGNQLLQGYRDQWYRRARCDFVFEHSRLFATPIKVLIGRYLADIVPVREHALRLQPLMRSYGACVHQEYGCSGNRQARELINAVFLHRITGVVF